MATQEALDRITEPMMTIRLVAKLLRSDATLDEVERDAMAMLIEDQSTIIFNLLCEDSKPSPA